MSSNKTENDFLIVIKTLSVILGAFWLIVINDSLVSYFRPSPNTYSIDPMHPLLVFTASVIEVTFFYFLIRIIRHRITKKGKHH